MLIHMHRHLATALPHLLLNIIRVGSLLDQGQSERMPEVAAVQDPLQV